MDDLRRESRTLALILLESLRPFLVRLNRLLERVGRRDGE